jgi:hypothetical protein
MKLTQISLAFVAPAFPKNVIWAYNTVSVRSSYLEPRVSLVGHNEKSPFSALCQLPPAADITTQMLTPLGAQQRTHAVQQNPSSFDHVIGDCEQRCRDNEH